MMMVELPVVNGGSAVVVIVPAATAASGWSPVPPRWSTVLLEEPGRDWRWRGAGQWAAVRGDDGGGAVALRLASWLDAMLLLLLSSSSRNRERELERVIERVLVKEMKRK
jgi:hypothetical protein